MNLKHCSIRVIISCRPNNSNNQVYNQAGKHKANYHETGQDYISLPTHVFKPFKEEVAVVRGIITHLFLSSHTITIAVGSVLFLASAETFRAYLVVLAFIVKVARLRRAAIVQIAHIVDFAFACIR
jgi:hypothetical protein